ncbi:hypothetical protein V9T40_009738 [Parthenolecanium corni]|uniref:Uncharacterized protein n=1 Tax=Parthenolecanium corni TaxID=536013 RepID=A0AAN9Y932_9HEMI
MPYDFSKDKSFAIGDLDIHFDGGKIPIEALLDIETIQLPHSNEIEYELTSTGGILRKYKQDNHSLFILLNSGKIKQLRGSHIKQAMEEKNNAISPSPLNNKFEFPDLNKDKNQQKMNKVKSPNKNKTPSTTIGDVPLTEVQRQLSEIQRLTEENDALNTRVKRLEAIPQKVNENSIKMSNIQSTLDIMHKESSFMGNALQSILVKLDNPRTLSSCRSSGSETDSTYYRKRKPRYAATPSRLRNDIFNDLRNSEGSQHDCTLSDSSLILPSSTVNPGIGNKKSSRCSLVDNDFLSTIQEESKSGKASRRGSKSGGSDAEHKKSDSAKDNRKRNENSESEKDRRINREKGGGGKPPGDSPSSSSSSSSEDDRRSRKDHSRKGSDKEPSDRDRKKKFSPISNLPERGSRRSSRSFLNNTASFCSKSIQDMHKKSLEIETFQGPEKDKRGPLQFIREFHTQIFEKINDDQIAGEIFMSLVKKSVWCSTWSDKLRPSLGYERMRSIFLQMEWTIEVQEFYYDCFRKENRENSRFTNFLDYYNHWCDKLSGTKHSDAYVLKHFRDNLPDRIQAKINLNKVSTIRQFDRIINKLPYDDLEWTSLHQSLTMEKRKELLAKMGAKGYEKKLPSPSFTSQNQNRSFPSNRYTPKINAIQESDKVENGDETKNLEN